jgi:hypothetical protein
MGGSDVASQGVVHGVGGVGLRQRRGPTGGAAKGIPRKVTVSFTLVAPTTGPYLVCTVTLTLPWPAAAKAPETAITSSSMDDRARPVRAWAGDATGGFPGAPWATMVAAANNRAPRSCMVQWRTYTQAREGSPGAGMREKGGDKIASGLHHSQ